MPLPPVAIPDTAQQGPRRFHAAREILARAVADEAFPGAACGVWLNGSVVALDSVGAFTYDAGAPAVTPATVYDLASLTKVIATTSMAMLLHQDGALLLDLPLEDSVFNLLSQMTQQTYEERLAKLRAADRSLFEWTDAECVDLVRRLGTVRRAER